MVPRCMSPRVADQNGNGVWMGFGIRGNGIGPLRRQGGLGFAAVMDGVWGFRTLRDYWV